MNLGSKLIRVLAAIMTALLLLTSFAEGGVIFGLGPDEAYTELTDAFDFSQYDEARKVLEEHPELLQMDYEDTAKYSTYLEALSYMDKGEFYVASQLFEGLKDFRNSLTMAYYTAGRNAEKNGDYEQAEALYRECTTYADAKDRLIDCGKKKLDALEKEADSLYSAGVAEKKVSSLERAYEIYKSLGDSHAAMAQKCLEMIAAINLKAEYDDAVSDFIAAEKDGNEQRISELKTYFEGLGKYESSEEYVKRAASFLENLSRQFSIEALEVLESEITFVITDTASGKHEYEIAVSSVNAPAEEIYTVSEKSFTIANLVCGTDYKIRASVKDAEDFVSEISVKTKPAALFEENGFTVSKSYLLGLKRSYLNKRTFEEIWMGYANNFTRFDDYMLSPEDTFLKLQTTVYPYLVSYKADAAFEEPVSIRWVLRTKSAGIYVYDMTGETELAQSGIIYLYLENILDEIYTQMGAWPRESMTIELYINDMLAHQGYITIKNS